MDGVGISIIGRPRPLPGHDTPNPAYHPHTLNYEEPFFRINVALPERDLVRALGRLCEAIAALASN